MHLHNFGCPLLVLLSSLLRVSIKSHLFLRSSVKCLWIYPQSSAVRWQTHRCLMLRLWSCLKCTRYSFMQRYVGGNCALSVQIQLKIEILLRSAYLYQPLNMVWCGHLCFNLFCRSTVSEQDPVLQIYLILVHH